MKPRRSVVVFDLGGVLIDWNPRHLYRKLFAGDTAAMEEFLATVCTGEWNRAQDAGRSFAEAAALLKAQHPPHRAALIDAYGERFQEMIPGPIAGTLDILAELRARGTPLYALSNWSAETYPPAFARFDFLRWFAGIVISGEEGIIKPDPRVYDILLRRFAIDPASAVYIDDSRPNAEAAAPFGMHPVHFTTPEALRAELAGLGLL